MPMEEEEEEEEEEEDELSRGTVTCGRHILLQVCNDNFFTEGSWKW